MKNVIDMTIRRRAQIKRNNKLKISDSAAVVDMVERREAAIQEERRTAKRTILTEFIGAFAVIPQHGLQKVIVHDISDDGISFDSESEMGYFKTNEEVALRVYLTQTTYFPVVVKISNVRYIEKAGAYRHGSLFVKDMVQKDALFHFVRFIELVCSSLSRDEGDLKIQTNKKR